MTRIESDLAEGQVSHPRRNRTMWVALCAVLIAVVLLAVGGAWWLHSTSGVQARGERNCMEVPVENSEASTGGHELKKGVCAALEALTGAWVDQNAEEYGEVFTEDAKYTTFAGTHYVGRDEIVASHEALFDGPLADTGLANHYISLRALTDDVVLLTTRGDTYDDEAPESPSKIQSYTLVDEGGEWKIATFHNTQRKPIMERVQFLWMTETIAEAER